MSQYSLTAISAAILLIAIGSRLISSTVLRRNPGSFGLLVGAVMWSLGQAATNEAPEGTWRLIALGIQYGALGWLPPFLVGTATSFGRKPYRANRIILGILIVCSTIFTLVVATNHLTGWFFSQISVDPVTRLIIKTKGIAYPYCVAYLALAASYAIGKIAWHQRKSGKFPSKRARVLLVAFSIPTLVAVAESQGLTGLIGLSLTPLSLLLAALVLMWGITDSKLLSPLSLAQKRVVDSLSEPVIISEPLGDLLYLNSSARQLSPTEKNLATAFPQLLACLPGNGSPPGQVRIANVDWAVSVSNIEQDPLEPPTVIISLHNISMLAAQAAQLETQVQQRTKDLERAVREKELLLRELHHRVKNNLQIIISLIKLQSNRIKQPDLLAILQAMKERIFAISLVHERMHRESFDGGLDFGNYVSDLVLSVFNLFKSEDLPAPTITTGDKRYVASVDICVDLGLAINELLTNAYKHAVLPGRTQLSVEMIPNSRSLCLLIRDHGPGLDLSVKPPENSLGMNIVRSIFLKYNIPLAAGMDGGAWISLTIPLSDDGLHEFVAADLTKE